MENKNIYEEVHQLCVRVRGLVEGGNLREADQAAVNAMSVFPHMPQPHNLLGIVLERYGDHVGAMKHFRAACALDASYWPARANMEKFGTYGGFNEREVYEEEYTIPEGKKQD